MLSNEREVYDINDDDVIMVTLINIPIFYLLSRPLNDEETCTLCYIITNLPTNGRYGGFFGYLDYIGVDCIDISNKMITNRNLKTNADRIDWILDTYVKEPCGVIKRW